MFPAMLFGPKMNTVFKSRWNALFWGAGVLLTAYCSVPSQDGQDQSGDAVAALLAAQGARQHSADQHANPWAKDPQ